jgi:hypothetical protein
MSSDQRIWVFLAGIASGSLFVLAAGGLVSSLLLIYTPFLPLLLVGLMLGAPSAMLASGIASGLSGLGLQSLGGAVMFLAIFALPTMFYLRQTLTQIKINDQPFAYYPQGLTLTKLSFYAAILVAFMTLAINESTGGTGLAGLLPPVTEGEPEWMETARIWMVDRAYLILGGTAWIQLSMFYGLAVLANAILAEKKLSLRPHLTLTPFMPSGILLVALLGAGVISFAEDAATVLAAKSAFITLLFPYFLMGVSRMHRVSLFWPNRGILLTLVYFFLLMFPPLLMVFIGLGLAAQARYLSNRSLGSGQAS